ncbi:MAG TPA: DUF58 domain-containing protein, partial [Acidimicrobiales bacterium]|nr:DUF58 domain-containing protein [Acidimicrobiales bacterium]
AAAAAPSPAVIGLCAGVAVALGAAAITVVGACRRQVGTLRGTFTGPELVQRGDEANVTLHLAGVAPAFGCRLCFDRSSLRWGVRRPDPTIGREDARSGRLAPAPGDRLPVGTAGLGPSAGRWGGAGESADPATLSVAVPTGQRGVQMCHAAALWLYDPLGLVGVRLATLPDLTVVVHPVPIRAPLNGLLCQPRPSDRYGTVRFTSTRPEGDDLIGLRPYRPGDRLSSLHWRSAVGTSSLLVREVGGTGESPARLILDDRAGIHRRAAFEAALDILASALIRPASAAPTVELRSLASADALSVVVGKPTPALLRWLAVVEPRRGLGLGTKAWFAQWDPGPDDVVITTATGVGSLTLLQEAGALLVVAG